MRATRLTILVICILLGLSACSNEGGESADRFAIPEIDPDLVTLARTDSSARASIPLAYVDGEPVEAGMLETQLSLLLKEDTRKEFSGNPDVLQIALSAILDQMVLTLEAEKNGITLTRAQEHEIELARVRMVSDRYLKTVVKEMATPGDDEVFEFYNNNQQGYLNPIQVTTRHILVNSAGKAGELKGLIDGGADFKDLCRRHSLDENSREIAGFQGPLYPSREVLGVGTNSKYVDFATTLDVNEVGLFETSKGWHVVQVVKAEGGDVQPFEEVKEEIRIGMGQKNWGATYNQVCLDLRSKYAVTMSQEGMQAYAQVKDNVARLFIAANDQEEPKGKIEMWRKIVFDYPKSPLSAEAQFMIAYTYLNDLHDHYEANRQIDRLTKRYQGSDWAKAGAYLQKYVNPDAKKDYSSHQHDEYGGHDLESLEIEGPYEILKIVREGSAQ